MLNSQHKGSNAISIISPVVDEEITRPGHWLGFCVPFNCLDTTVRWQEEYPVLRNPVPLTQRFLLEQAEEEDQPIG